MIGVCVVNRVVFPFAYIGGKWLPVVMIVRWLFRFLAFPLFNKVSNPRVRTGGVIRRVAQLEDIFIFTDRKTLDLAELWVLQFLRSSSVKWARRASSFSNSRPRHFTDPSWETISSSKRLPLPGLPRTTFVLNKLSCLLIFIILPV